MQYFIVDVFTDEAFKGNPLAVVLDADSLSSERMQAITREFNLSETTFVLKPTASEAEKRIRIFTPAQELPLAGHPVVGTWHLLAAKGIVRVKEGWNVFKQEVLAGILPVEILIEKGILRQVRMTQARPEYFEVVSDDRLLTALGLTFENVNRSLPSQFVSTGMKQLMLPLRSRADLSRIRPLAQDLGRLLADRDSHLVYAFAEEDRKVFARAFFSMGSFMGEDPATGSAAGALGAYLWKHRSIDEPLEIHQGVEMGRAAKINVKVSSDGDVVKVGGSAVIVAQGELL
jgi:trans-2,3-dihydro-3-hydroxyanthranilate isomerase